MKINYEKRFLEIVPENAIEEAYLENIMLYGKSCGDGIHLRICKVEQHRNYAPEISYLTTESKSEPMSYMTIEGSDSK